MAAVHASGADWARERFGAARVARLATLAPAGAPRIVPIVFAPAGEQIFTAIDGKPKASDRPLARLRDLAANPQVSVLADEYDEDWSRLWWARADGTARVVDGGPEADAGRAALRARYPQYATVPLPGPVIVIDVARWSGWSATGWSGR